MTGIANSNVLCAAIYDCAVNQSNWDSVVDRTVDFVGAKGAMFASIPTGDAGENWLIRHLSRIWRELPPEQIRFLTENFYQYEQEAWHTLLKARPLFYQSDTDLYSDTDNLNNREDYVYLKKHVGILRKVGIRLNSDHGWFDSIAFQFDQQYELIPDASGVAINQISIHFAKAAELSRTFNQLRQQYQAVLAALDHVDIGMCIFNAGGVLVTANQEANRIIEEAGHLYVSQKKQLRCRDGAANDTLAFLLREAIHSMDASPNDRVVVLKREGESPVFFHVSRLRDSSAELGEKLEGAMVSIVDMAKAKEYDASRFSVVYELTHAEEVVTKYLLEGLSNNEIAEIRKVSVETIKKQIQSVYTKSEVNNRVDLVKLILKTTPPVIV